MTRVERNYNYYKDLLELYTKSLLTEGANNPIIYRQIYDNIGEVLHKVGAYKILNDIRLEKLYLIDNENGNIVPVQFT